MKVTLTGKHLSHALQSVMNNHGYLGFVTITIEINRGEDHFPKVLKSIEDRYGTCIKIEQSAEGGAEKAEGKKQDAQEDDRMSCACLAF